MVNLLQYQLPKSVAGYKIRTSYKLMVAFEEFIHVNANIELIPETVLKQVFIDDIDDQRKATAALLWWYSCGAAFEEQDEAEKEKPKKAKPYNYTFDEGAIIADFAQYYNIRLAVEDLHWFEFQKLLMNLPNDSQFKRRIYYRTADLADVNKYEKDSFIKLRNLYKIEKPKSKMSAAEREQELKDKIERAYEDMLAHELENEK